MVNNSVNLRLASSLVTAYVVLTWLSIAALVVLAITAPAQATNEAWGHAIIVGVLSVVLPLRMRAARQGSDGAVRAVSIIAVVLLVVNLVEALLPGTFPVWMRVEMVLVVVVTALLVGVMTGRVASRDGAGRTHDALR